MLRNYVCETSTAPGTSSTVNLAGAVAGRLAFVGAFANGAACYYFMTDGTQAEWGYGIFSTGAPNTITRGTVLGNTAGSFARLNFTGTTTVYNEIPAERAIYADGTLLLTLPGGLTVPGDINANGQLIVAGTLQVGAGIVINGGGAINGGLTIATGALVITTGGAPASAGATGVPGQIAWDSGFIYVCVATNTWKRVAIATF